MKPKHVLLSFPVLLLFAALSALILWGCRKADLLVGGREASLSAEQKFFAHSGTLSPQVSRVMGEFGQRQKGGDLVGRLSQKHGYPVWDKAFVRYGSSKKGDKSREGGNGMEKVVIVPLVQPDSTQVLSYIEAHLGTEVRLFLRTAGEYKNLSFSENS
jgi:hypothetical protein